jgi:hypothetical protein
MALDMLSHSMDVLLVSLKASSALGLGTLNPWLGRGSKRRSASVALSGMTDRKLLSLKSTVIWLICF